MRQLRATLDLVRHGLDDLRLMLQGVCCICRRRPTDGRLCEDCRHAL